MRYNVFCIVINMISKFESSQLWDQISIFELASLYCADKLESLIQISCDQKNAILMLSREIHAFESQDEFLENKLKLEKQASEKEKKQKEQTENMTDFQGFCQCIFISQDELISSEEELQKLKSKFDTFRLIV